MATRNQVLSLFGATPEQVREQELQRQRSFLNSQQSGFGRAGAAIGTGISRLFGGKSAEMTQAEQLQDLLKGVDVGSPESLREAAKKVADIAPNQALQISAYASQLERDQMLPTVNMPVQVGTKPKYVLNPLTQQYDQVGEEPIFRDVPFERLPGGGLRSLDPRYSLSDAQPEDVSGLSTPSEEALAQTNAEQTMARVLTRDPETGRLTEAPAPSVGEQPTLDLTQVEQTNAAVPPSPVIQGTATTPLKVAQDSLADVNRQLSLRRKKLTEEDKAFLIARRKELRDQISKLKTGSTSARTRRK